jgi:outer membrane protein assembly factor BamB
VIIKDDILIIADRNVKKFKDKQLQWGVHGWNERGFERVGQSTITGYEISTGKQLWSQRARGGYNAPVDVFVVGDIAWVGQQFGVGYNIRTGAVTKMNAKADRVGMVHPRCYRNKATTNWIVSCRDGMEFLEVGKGWKENNSWARGACQYGIMPANGLIYVPPDSCACNSQVKVQGWNIFSAKLPKAATIPVAELTNPLVKGSAYSKAAELAKKPLKSTDWPAYRHNVQRGGATPSTISPKLADGWSTKLSGRLTQPIAAHGLAYVASIDSHTLHALDITSGKAKWQYIAGGRIDSAPTLHGGLILFGSMDGWVHCLDAMTGDLVWRLRAAPGDQTIMIFGQLESSWPVHGSVLIQNGELYCTAGRNSCVDGGIYFYRIDPVTGTVQARNVIRHRDPVTGKYYQRHGSGFDMAGTRNDLLSGDGKTIYLAKTRLDRDGKEMKNVGKHLFTPTGFLGEEWFVRSYWMYGTRAGTGWGGWAQGGTKSFSGRIMSFDDNEIFGYGRKRVAAAAVGHRSENYHFFGGSLKATPKKKPEPPPRDPKERRKWNRRRHRGTPVTYKWSNKIPIMGRAMVLTKEHVVLAGLPDIGKKPRKEMIFTNNQEALDALHGKKGSSLVVYNRTDGTQLNEIKLDVAPVFDSAIVTDGRVLMCMEDGSIRCWVTR